MMTDDQLAALRQAVKDRMATDGDLADAYARKDCAAIATVMSVGRTRATTMEIGNGTILEVLGVAAGNSLLDAIHAQPSYKYVIALLDQGRLKVGSPMTKVALEPLVASGAVAQADCDKLLALGIEPDPLITADVHAALYEINGTPL